jgi:hypothetical protein
MQRRSAESESVIEMLYAERDRAPVFTYENRATHQAL